jgi:hypothetical protein
MMFDLETHGMPSRSNTVGRFSYELCVYRGLVLDHTITGTAYGPTLRDVTERLEAEWRAKGVDEARLRIYGPYYAENRLAPDTSSPAPASAGPTQIEGRA